jgi:hypothetical protein
VQFKEPGEANYWLELQKNCTTLSPAARTELNTSSGRLYRMPSVMKTTDSSRRRSSLSGSSSQPCTPPPLAAAAAAAAADSFNAADRDGMQFESPDAAGSNECLQSEETMRERTYNDDSTPAASVSTKQHRQSPLQPLLERTATPFHLRWRERDNV